MESPVTGRKFKLQNEHGSFKIKSAIKIEKMQTALSNNDVKSPCSSGAGTPDLVCGPTIYSRLKNSEDQATGKIIL